VPKQAFRRYPTALWPSRHSARLIHIAGELIQFRAKLDDKIIRHYGLFLLMGWPVELTKGYGFQVEAGLYAVGLCGVGCAPG
jgi:hypothetical protein